jgi:hypothetical protein
VPVETWILAFGGVFIDLGLSLSGWRIMRSLGNNITFVPRPPSLLTSLSTPSASPRRTAVAAWATPCASVKVWSGKAVRLSPSRCTRHSAPHILCVGAPPELQRCVHSPPWSACACVRCDAAGPRPLALQCCEPDSLSLSLTHTHTHTHSRALKGGGGRHRFHSPSRGFAMELGALTTVLYASQQGKPVSTTHCITGATVGVGLCGGDLRCVNWLMVSKQVGLVTHPRGYPSAQAPPLMRKRQV